VSLALTYQRENANMGKYTQIAPSHLPFTLFLGPLIERGCGKDGDFAL